MLTHSHKRQVRLYLNIMLEMVLFSLYVVAASNFFVMEIQD